MAECCCEEKKPPVFVGKTSGCMLCGKPLHYEKDAVLRRCAICGEEKPSSCSCEDGHFVCDRCHSAGLDVFFVPLLLHSEEPCPQRLLEQVLALPQVHLHGPEHHAIVPCVLLTAFHNCGGGNDLKADLSAALKRGRQVPGGTCGYWGACGAAIGAGIYLSILLGSSADAGVQLSARYVGMRRRGTARRTAPSAGCPARRSLGSPSPARSTWRRSAGSAPGRSAS